MCKQCKTLKLITVYSSTSSTWLRAASESLSVICQEQANESDTPLEQKVVGNIRSYISTVELKNHRQTKLGRIYKNTWRMTVDYPRKELSTVQLLAFFAVCCPSGEIKMKIIISYRHRLLAFANSKSSKVKDIAFFK